MSEENFITQKKILRREIKSRLAAMSTEERITLSRTVIKKFVTLYEYRNAKIIMAYMSMPEEVQLQEFFLTAFEDGKILAVPFIEGREMSAAVMPNLDSLEVGTFGISTVKSEFRTFIDAEKIDCVILPGLAFNIHGQRLGKGGGFYDKFLTRAINAKKIALAYDCQIVESVPVEVHDLPADIVITPTKIFYN